MKRNIHICTYPPGFIVPGPSRRQKRIVTNTDKKGRNRFSKTPATRARRLLLAAGTKSDRVLCAGDGHWYSELVFMLPNGSSNSTKKGRANTSGFLTAGGICPDGYAPDQRNYFPAPLPERSIRFLVGRPLDMPLLASRGCIHVFIAFGDVVCEATTAGLCGIERLTELPYGEIDQVIVVRRESPFSTMADFLSCAPVPIGCVSELPFLARSAFHQNKVYQKRFGVSPPVIERYGRKVADGSELVSITESAGSCEPLIAEGFYDCAMVARSSGDTIRDCGLKVVGIVGTYYPGFFCRAGLRNNPVLAAELDWFVQRLEVAKRRWEQLNEHAQLVFPFQAA